jgi:integrase
MPPLSVDTKRLDENTRLVSAMLSGLRTWKDQGKLDPLSLDVIERMRRMTKSIGCALAWSKLRYSDVVKLTTEDVLSETKTSVTAGKTGKTREIDPIRPDGEESRFQSVPESAILDISSYSMVAEDIRTARAEARVNIPGVSKDGTHLFRHLHASWLFKNGATRDEVRQFFGHDEISVTNQYIHDWSMIEP